MCSAISGLICWIHFCIFMDTNPFYVSPFQVKDVLWSGSLLILLVFSDIKSRGDPLRQRGPACAPEAELGKPAGRVTHTACPSPVWSCEAVAAPALGPGSPPVNAEQSSFLDLIPRAVPFPAGRAAAPSPPLVVCAGSQWSLLALPGAPVCVQHLHGLLLLRELSDPAIGFC